MGETIYERIKKAAAQMTIQQLEIELGFSAGIIQKWKTSCPSAANLYSVSKKLNVPMEYLLTGVSEENKGEKNFLVGDNSAFNIGNGEANNTVQTTATPATPPLSDMETLLLKAFGCLKQEDKLDVLNYARSVADNDFLSAKQKERIANFKNNFASLISNCKAFWKFSMLMRGFSAPAMDDLFFRVCQQYTNENGDISAIYNKETEEVINGLFD